MLLAKTRQMYGLPEQQIGGRRKKKARAKIGGKAKRINTEKYVMVDPEELINPLEYSAYQKAQKNNNVYFKPKKPSKIKHPMKRVSAINPQTGETVEYFEDKFDNYYEEDPNLEGHIRLKKKPNLERLLELSLLKDLNADAIKDPYYSQYMPKAFKSAKDKVKPILYAESQGLGGKKRKLSKYNQFVKKHAKGGKMSLEEIGQLWRESGQSATGGVRRKKKRSRALLTPSQMVSLAEGGRKRRRRRN